nr:MAG TPA: hypothetical protein [Bacteriophage sp.]
MELIPIFVSQFSISKEKENSLSNLYLLKDYNKLYK